ncbi:MAG: hypothetical protein KDA55_03620, partial [Planctomycetales bacterium]|nr:hypothetical protein [Planctomycetales bacterium]
GGKLYVWNVADRSLVQAIELSASPRCIAITSDGRRVAVVGGEGQVRLHDTSSGALLRRIEVEMPVDSLAFVDKETTLTLGFRDGRVAWYPVAMESWIDAHEGPVNSVCFSGDRHLLTAGADGQVLLWDVENSTEPLRRYIGRDAEVVQARVSPTTDHVVGVFADDTHAVAVWPLAMEQTTTDVKPLALFEHPQAVRCALTSSDGKSLITGGTDIVRLWEIASGKELARFQGNEAAVADLQLDSLVNSIVAVASDRSVRMWNLPAIDPAAVPEDAEKLAALDSDRKFTVDELTSSEPETLRVRPGATATRSGNAGPRRPVDGRIVSLEERLRSAENEQDRVAARNLLQRARRERQLLDELDTARDNEQRAAIRRRLEALARSENAEATAFERFADLRQQISTAADDTARTALREQLVEEQREHFRSTTELAAATDNATAVVYDDGHPHVMATIRTNYRFQQNDRHVHRPVRLLVSQDMSVVIAAQSSVPGSKETELPGFVEAWDVFSGEKLREWDEVRNSSVNELHFSPDFQSIVTYPNLYHFNLAYGTSEPFAMGCRLATYRGQDPSKEGLIAVGTQGPADAEAPVLRFLSGNPLAPRPVNFNAYDAKVTSLAFANRRPTIAFAVRERAAHKVLVADANLAVTTMISVDTHRHHRPWNIEEPVLGTTSLAFSPHDKYLVTYGVYDDLPEFDKRRMYQATVWQADWEARKFTKVFESEPKRDPLMLEIGSQPIRFVGDTSLVSLPTSDGFMVVDLEEKGEPVATISLPAVQKGRPETCISDDGRWLAAGDDTGQITLWNLQTGKSQPLTLDGRPAHGGPVVGLAFSATHPQTGTIDFLVSAGEENKIKIWSLVERLEPKLYEAPVEPKPRPAAARVSRTR